MAKRTKRLDNLHSSVRAPAIGSTALLSSCLTLVSSPRPLASSFSCFVSPTYLFPLPTCPRTPTTLLSCSVPALVPGSLIVLLLLPVFSLTPFYLTSTAFRTFKQTFLDKFLHHSTSTIDFFCSYLSLGLLSNKINCKQTFNIAFINSHPLADNYA